ncbi:unnamed protein product [Cylicocyclus nassatus]|uniref:Uncharacterized protein n=1 Tax=Cylicocyclus nassatus TaxID=53992 RepID=A0AA36GTD4_CYLNA|nr:unnamed protein product [Cylicocyclus nassatus]
MGTKSDGVSDGREASFWSIARALYYRWRDRSLCSARDERIVWATVQEPRITADCLKIANVRRFSSWG